MADVLLVNPIRDGMNLVAEEGPILSERGCALVLSREAGAAALIGDAALIVNPYDVTATAEALHAGLSMPATERRRRSAGSPPPRPPGRRGAGWRSRSSPSADPVPRFCSDRPAEASACLDTGS